MTDEKRRYADSLTTSDGRSIRIASLPADKIVRVGPKHTRIRVGDIPLNAVRLSCGDTVRGIALEKGNVMFCEKHHDNVFVAEVVAGDN